MRRYLLALEADLNGADKTSSPVPINYLAARQEQWRHEQPGEEPSEVVVLTVVSAHHVQAPPFVRPHTAGTVGKQPGAAPPGDDVRAAEDRAAAVVRQLEVLGFRATGLLSGQPDLVKAVRAELRARHYSEVIAVTGQQGGWITRLLGVDPVRRLQRRLGRRLVVFPARTPAPQVAAAADRPERAAS